LVAKALGQPLHYLSHQPIRVLDSPARLIDKAALYFVPTRPKIFFFLGREERTKLFSVTRRGGSCGRKFFFMLR